MKAFVIYFLCLISTAGISKVYPDNISWSQKTLNEMTTEEKIGQLFMIAGYVDADFAQREIGNAQMIQEIDQYISKYHVGGIAFVGPSEAAKQVSLINHYQEISKYPILIAQDLEWGLAMRIKDGMQFPKNITLGAVKDNKLIYEMGKEVGRQAKLIGVHMNLSPVLDVNIEPENLVINIRSFGSSPVEVAEKGVAMLRGIQDSGTIASAKHFPGLGDISTDPHLGLPHVKHDRKRLQEVEFYPFVKAIESGLLSIQLDHVLIPALEPDSKISSSISYNVVEEILKQELGFKGLVLSGALRMKALTASLPEEEIILRAFQAGNDMLLMPQDFPKAYHVIKNGLKEGKISLKEIDQKVLKILEMKQWAHLDQQRMAPIPTFEQLHTQSAKQLKKELYANAVCLLRNEKKLLPNQFKENRAVAFVQVGDSQSNEFFKTLKKQLSLEVFELPLENENISSEEDLLKKLEKHAVVILSVFPADPRRIVEIRLANEAKQKELLKEFRVHGITPTVARLLKKLQPLQHKIIVVFFGNPFGLHFLDPFSTVIMGYESDPDAQQAAAAILMAR